MSLGDEVFNNLVHLGDKWAEAQFNAQQVEDTEKTYFSQIAQGFMQDNPGLSAAKAEIMARASADFHGFILNKCKLRLEANKAKVRYDSAKVLADMRRTEEANRRYERSITSA